MFLEGTKVLFKAGLGTFKILQGAIFKSDSIGILS